MLRRLLLTFLPVALVVLLGGCAQVLSPAALAKVDPGLDFTEVKADPQAHLGQTLLLGGLIVDNRSDADGTTLELLRYFTDRWGRPTGPDEVGGRYLVRSPRFLDPELYRKGLLATLTGTVAGAQSATVHGRDFTYPLFTLDEVYLWRTPDPWSGRPRDRFADPYAPWPYGCDYGWGYPRPYWYGPGPYWYDDGIWLHYDH